jgi:alkylation response protein AidB-like acyl-CoA dehydrogenase
MDFRITAEQKELRDGIAAWLAGEHGPETVRRLADTGEGADAIRAGLVALGLPALLVPEADGGLGLDLVEGVLASVEIGRACVSDPVVETALVAAPWICRRGGGELLGAIARGEAIVALAHPANPWVADLDRAGWLLAGGMLRQTDGINASPIESVDPGRRQFAFEASEDDGLLLDLAALISAGQLLGLAEAMLEMARDYALERVQFGKPIGSFQAIKHHLADVALGIEFARPVLMRAALSMQDDEPLASQHVSHAKLACSRAAWAAGEHAIQVHGAMGYTYEVDLHFWMKRAWALTGAWGDQAFHATRVEDALFARALPAGPENTFASRSA